MQLNSSNRVGVYHLSQGTDGCPDKVQWLKACDGFKLKSFSKTANSSKTTWFCEINHGPVIQEGNILRKAELQTVGSGRQALQVSASQILIFDSKDKFIWETDVGGFGTSCLFQK